MKPEQKIELYHNVAKSLNKPELAKIKQYYLDWEYNELIQLKHRFTSCFVWDETKQNSKWLRIDKYFNKRRVKNSQLANYIRQLIEADIYPLRIFHSVSEWLDPRSVISGNKKTRMINSGLLVFENDDNLSKSISCAKELNNLLAGKKTFVYSGNISIHTWWHEFDARKYLDVDETTFIKEREYYDRVARYNMYEKIQNKIKYNLDKRVTIDSRRIVPIIDTLNVITMRKVILLNDLNITAKELKKLATFR